MPKLQDRERRVLLVGGIASAAIIIFLIAEGPYTAYVESEAKLDQARERLRQAQTIHRTVLRKRDEQQQINQRLRATGGGFDLLTFINSAVQSGGLATRATIDNATRGAADADKFASVKVSMRGISLAELVDFLHTVYGSGNLIVLNNVDTLEPAPDQTGLNCEMVFLAPRA